MKTNKGYELGSWKCGKGKAFTHISTNFTVFLKKTSLIYGFKKRGEHLL